MIGSEIRRATTHGTRRGVADGVGTAKGHSLATDEAVVGIILDDATLVAEGILGNNVEATSVAESIDASPRVLYDAISVAKSIDAGPRDADRVC